MCAMRTGPFNFNLKWYDVTLKMNVAGKPKDVVCTFLCATEFEARMRGTAFAQTEEGSVSEVTVKLADVQDRTGKAPIVTDPPNPQPEKPKVRPEVVAAFVAVDVDVPVSLYVQQIGAT